MQKRSFLQKSLITGALSLSAIAMTTGCASSEKKVETTENKEEVVDETTSRQSTKPSGIDTENFDSTVRAQDNFYKHVNGKWLEKTEIPADRSNYGSFSVLGDNSEKALLEIIQEMSKKESAAGTVEQKIGDAYKSFMDEEAIEKAGTTALKTQHKAIKKMRSSKDVAKMMGKFNALQISSPVVIWVDQDSKNTTQHAMYMNQAGLGLPDRDYYLEDNDKQKAIRADYLVFMEKILKLAGEKNAKKSAAKIMALETEIAKIHWSREERRDRDKSYNKVMIADQQKEMPAVSFKSFFEGIGYNQPESIIVRQPTYFKALSTIVKKTSVKTWRAYFAFHLYNNAAPYLNKDFVDTKFDFYGKKLSGTTENRPRWKRGVSFVEGVLGHAIGQVYVQKHFPAEAKTRMNDLIKNLRAAYEVAINGLEWMGEDTKKAAQNKLTKFITKIGYPDKWKDYTALNITSASLLENIMASNAFDFKHMMDKMGQQIDRDEWHMFPQTVNAYYNPSMNEIVFPAAILQPPFFDLNADDAANYGGIGAVIGHEISHGFDDQGRKSNGDGNLVDWWTAEDATKFEARAKKLGDLYDTFHPFEDAHVNGPFTMGENIGDLGGVTVAFKAYQMSLKGAKSPIINEMTGEQRFFYSYAQIWRRKYREEELRRRLKTDPHSPSQYRVLGILSNIPAFYEAFDVKEGDKMYIAPENRVKIW